MATLYVENIPDDRYEALRKRARSQHRSIAAEVLILLESHIPTEKELKARKKAARKLLSLNLTKNSSPASVASSVDMIREDRER
jgi:plasmid stability protein